MTECYVLGSTLNDAYQVMSEASKQLRYTPFYSGMFLHLRHLAITFSDSASICILLSGLDDCYSVYSGAKHNYSAVRLIIGLVALTVLNHVFLFLQMCRFETF